jgi:hypothetical protein
MPSAHVAAGQHLAAFTEGALAMDESVWCNTV